MAKLIIKGELTDLNTYINAERANRFFGASIKKKNTELVEQEIMIQRLKPITEPVDIHITWYVKNSRKDPDNVAFAKKFILDGLVKMGVLKNDTMKEIKSFQDTFIVDKDNPRIECSIIYIVNSLK